MPYYVGNRHDLARGFCVLDELCFGTGMVELPHIVKIDVEGAEVEVLDGMRMIAAKRFPHTYVECHLGPENENRVRLFFVMYRIPTQRSTPTIIEVSRQGYNTFLYSMSHKASS